MISPRSFRAVRPQIVRQLAILTVSSLISCSWAEVASSQTPEVAEPASPSPVTLPIPDLTTPDLPGIGDFSRYQPQDQQIYLVLQLGRRQVRIYEGEKVLATYPVAIGRPAYPTPTGEFKVFQMIVNPAWQSPWTGEVEAPGADGSLGLRWIGFVELSAGIIGFHGTPNVASIGQAVSHGCVRMRNEDIVKMYDLIKIGTLVRVEP